MFFECLVVEAKKNPIQSTVCLRPDLNLVGKFGIEKVYFVFSRADWYDTGSLHYVSRVLSILQCKKKKILN